MAPKHHFFSPSALQKRGSGPYVTYSSRLLPVFGRLKARSDVKLHAAILVARLEARFKMKPDGFYKLIAPAQGNRWYREGDSWCEELGFTARMFARAWGLIGITHTSYTTYLAAQFAGSEFHDPGTGKMNLYCCARAREGHRTWWYRNHERCDTMFALDP